MTTFDTLEKQRAELLGWIGNWPDHRLNFRPADTEWSALEVLDHVVRAEIGIVVIARRGLDKPHSIGLRDRLGFRFLDKIFQTDRKVRVPRSASMIVPDRNATLPDVRLRWEEARCEIAALLAAATPDHERMGVFRHPVSGWMTMPQLLYFFWLHIYHHRFQLDRLEAASEKSAAAGV